FIYNSLSPGASKPATEGRNSGVQNQPLNFHLITPDNLSCQRLFEAHIRILFGIHRPMAGVRHRFPPRCRWHTVTVAGSATAFP
ncbi:MAG: hypothetical protein ACYDBH_23600, partial [Acidobacteriaceae bacterium]